MNLNQTINIMSKFFRLNSYTRILNDGKTSFEEKKKLLEQKSISKSSDYKEEKKVVISDRTNDYKKFCRRVFKNRNIISQKEFHSLIIEQFSGNVTWYRKRMIDLGLIIERNKLIISNYEKEGQSEKEA